MNSGWTLPVGTYVPGWEDKYCEEEADAPSHQSQEFFDVHVTNSMFSTFSV